MVLSAQFPVLQQLRLVRRGPFQNKSQRPARQTAHPDLQSFNYYLRMELSVLGVEVRRRVLIKEHPDDDTVESADRRLVHLSDSLKVGNTLGLKGLNGVCLELIVSFEALVKTNHSLGPLLGHRAD